MKITFLVPIANRRRGDVVDLDDGSAALLIAQGYAEPRQRESPRTIHKGRTGAAPAPAPPPDAITQGGG